MLLPTLNLYNRTKEFFDHIVQLLLLSFSGFATTVWETTGAYMNSDELGFERSLLLSHTGQYTEVSSTLIEIFWRIPTKADSKKNEVLL